MKNGKSIELEVRLARLEADVKEIKALLQNKKSESNKPWWEETIGMFKDDPVFAEIDRLGREFREKERREARRRTRKKKVKS